MTIPEETNSRQHYSQENNIFKVVNCPSEFKDGFCTLQRTAYLIIILDHKNAFLEMSFHASLKWGADSEVF
jgi:hypothetical protein